MLHLVIVSLDISQLFMAGRIMTSSIPSISPVCNEDISKIHTDIEKAPTPPTGTDGLQSDVAGTLDPDERLLDWSSPDDSECGQNWPLPVKIYHTVIASAMSFLMLSFSPLFLIPFIKILLST